MKENFPLKTHTIVLAIGPSECGKSHYFKKQAENLKNLYPEYRFSVLSSDENRRKFLGSELHKHDDRMSVASKAAFDFIYSELDILTSWPINHEVVFVDATHLTENARKPILDIAEKNGYNVAAVVFKFNKRDNYFNYCTGDKRIVIKHVDKFFKETLKGLVKIKDKYFITDNKVEAPNFIVSDYDEYKSHIVSGDYIVIGDIHGEVELLKEAIASSESIPLLVGDIVDKNSKDKVFDTVNFVYDQIKSGKMLMTIGNHDYGVYSWLVKNGKYTSDIISTYFSSALDIEKDEDVKNKFIWIVENSKHFYLHQDLKFIVTHAPCERKHLGKLRFLKEQRNFRYAKQDEFKTKEEWCAHVINQIRELEADEYGYTKHVFGHVAFSKDFYGKSFCGIDTGACYGNFLTTADFSGRRQFYKKFGKGGVKDGLVEITDKNKNIEYDLSLLDYRVRGRIFHSLDNGLPVFSGTVCPADKTDSELESLEWALDYFDNPVMQVKYMGSWSVIRLKKDPRECKTYSRNGYLIKKEGLEEAYNELIAKLPWDDIQEYIIGAELMPWRFLGDGLIDKAFYGLGFLTDQRFKYLKATGFQEAFSKLQGHPYVGDKKDIIEKFGHHAWSTAEAFRNLSKESYQDIGPLVEDNEKFVHQINLFGKEGKVHFKPFLVYKIVDNDGVETIHANNNLLAYDLGINNDEKLIIDKSIDGWKEKAYEFFNKLTTEHGYEGVVVKPVDNLEESFKAPYIKVRNPEYLRLVYGFDYLRHSSYHKSKKNIQWKLKESIKDWDRAMKLLEIPVGEINAKNSCATNLFADFIVGEQRQSSIDPRL